MTPANLDRDIQDAFDGELDEISAQRLRDTLRQSPEAIDRYCDHALLESELRRHTAGRKRIPGAVPARTTLASLTRRRRQVAIALASAAAVILFASLALHSVFIAPAQAIATVESSPQSILRFADGSAVTTETLRRKARITLEQGVAKLRIGNDVEAVIEGPASFSLTSADGLQMTSGHAWFRVPPAARGFRVTTPGFDLIDLGTEFGIDLREDLPPEVHVLTGSVELTARTGKKQSINLTAGRAMVLTPVGMWKPITARRTKFRNRLPAALPSLRLSFEQIEGNTLPLTGDIIGIDGATARITSPENAKRVPGIRGQALEFDGRSNAIETTWHGISGTAARTISLWCRIPDGHIATSAPPLALWGNPATGWNRKFKVALVSNPTGQTHLRLSFGQMLITGTTPLNDGAWHHLAVVYRGNDADGNPDHTLFVNGVPEPTSTILLSEAAVRTETDSTSSLNLSIGRYELPTPENPFLRAALDEFEIFAGALDETEIRRLAAKN